MKLNPSDTFARLASEPPSMTCAYAMAKLVERLAAEGYVIDARKDELLERAFNLQHGRGFLTRAELAHSQTAALQAKPAEPALEELF